MAKDKVKKPKTESGTKGAAKTAKAAKPAKTAKAGKVAKIAKGGRKIARNPMTTEVVAATLVAAAAALRNPKKAQALGREAADDLKKAAKTGVDGGALWQLALDVARKSIDTLGADDGKGKGKKAKPKKAKK